MKKQSSDIWEFHYRICHRIRYNSGGGDANLPSEEDYDDP